MPKFAHTHCVSGAYPFVRREIEERVVLGPFAERAPGPPCVCMSFVFEQVASLTTYTTSFEPPRCFVCLPAMHAI